MISDDMIIFDFGKRLKAKRVGRKMTQEQLGNAIGVDKSRISDYENGRRNCSIITAFRLSKALNVSLDSLLNENENDSDCNNKSTEKEKLSAVINSVGHAVTEWGFFAYSNDDFADYSTMYSIGLMENSFGEALQQFKSLVASSDLDEKISQIADACAANLLASRSFKIRSTNKFDGE